MGSNSYRDLVAWQQAIDLIDLVYDATRTWPREETYGLSGQIRRAAVSVAANVAEGQGRNGDREFINHLGIAFGSLCEVETLSVVARRQSYLTEDQDELIQARSARVGKLLQGLMKSLRTEVARGQRRETRDQRP